MNNLTKTLLGGVAIAALATPAMAAGHKHFAMHVQALHAGNVVNKSKLHNNGAQHLTYTFGVYSSQPASAPKKTHLIFTYYKWNSNFTLCSTPKMKMVVPKRSTYAKIGWATEAYSEGCPSGPTVFYGDTWTNKTGVAGDIDGFLSTLIGRFYNGSTKYKGELDIDVFVGIE